MATDAGSPRLPQLGQMNVSSVSITVQDTTSSRCEAAGAAAPVGTPGEKLTAPVPGRRLLLVAVAALVVVGASCAGVVVAVMGSAPDGISGADFEVSVSNASTQVRVALVPTDSETHSSNNGSDIIPEFSWVDTADIRADDPAGDQDDGPANATEPTIAIMRVGSHLLPVVQSVSQGSLPAAQGSSDLPPLQVQTGSLAAKLFGQDPPAYTGLAAAVGRAGEVEVVTAAPGSSRLYIQTFLKEGRFWEGSGWHSLAIQFQGSPSICSLANGDLMVAVRGLDSQIWHSTFSEGWWGIWHTIPGGVVSSGPTLVSNSTTVVLLARDSAGGVAVARSSDNGKAWTWTGLGGDVKESSSVAAALSAEGELLHVLVRGSDNYLWQLVLLASGSASPWRRLDTLGQVTSSPAISSTWSHVTVTVRGQDAATYWTDESLDGGQTFSGQWKSWNFGFESSPFSVALTGGNESITLGVNQRGQLAILDSNSGTAGNPAWASVGPLPRDSDAVLAGNAPMAAITSPGGPEQSCTPCGQCQFYDNVCWQNCSLSCSTEEAACVLRDDDVQQAAARHSCNYLWQACGGSQTVARHPTASSMFPTFNVTAAVGFKPDKEHRKQCQLRAEGFCASSIWRVNLYQVRSPGFQESCGRIVYHGSTLCKASYTYNLFKALTGASCQASAKSFYNALEEAAEVVNGSNQTSPLPDTPSPANEIVWKEPDTLP